MRHLYIICVALLLAGCSRKVYVPVETVSTRYVETERVTTRIDTVAVEIPVPAASVTAVTPDTASYLCTDLAESWAQWSEGRLTHTLRHLPASLSAIVPLTATDTIRVTERADTIYKPVEVQVPVETERSLTWWERTRLDCFTPLLIALLAALAWIFRKQLISLIQYILLKRK